MSELSNKGSFILHRDTLSILDEMNNEQAGVLFKSIFYYQTTGELPDLDFGMKMALSPFIAQFVRDSIRYEKAVTNGSKGGRPKLTSDNPSKPKLTSDNLKEPNLTQPNLEKPTITQHGFNKPRKPVSDSVSVSDSDSVSDSIKKKPVIDKNQTCKSSHDIILKWYNHIFRSNVRKIGTEDRRRLDKYIAEYEVDGCIEMLLGVTLDDWMMGENPQNTKYIGWGNIFKLNEDNFSRFSTKYHAATGNGAKWVKDITSPVGVSWWSQEHFSMSTAPDTHPWRVIKEQDIFTSDLLNDKFEYVWTKDETKEYTEHLESQRADKIVTQEVVTDGYQDPDDDTIPESWVIGDLEPVEDIAPWDDTNTPEPVF